MTSSEVFPAGISWAVTFSSGWSAFHALTICLPQAISSGLFDSQTLIGPVAAAASPEPPESPPQPAVIPSASMVRVAVTTFVLMCFSIRFCAGGTVSSWLVPTLAGPARGRWSRGRRGAAAASSTSVAGRWSISSSRRRAAARPQPMTSLQTVVSGRLDVGGELGVLVAGDRELVRARRSPREAATDEPGDGHQVVGVDDRGGRVGQVEQRRGWPRLRPRRRSRLSTQGPVGQPGPGAGRPPRPRGATGRGPSRTGRRRGRSGCARAPRGARRRRRCRARRRRRPRASRTSAGPVRRSPRAVRARRAGPGAASSTYRSVRKTPSTRPSSLSRR